MDDHTFEKELNSRLNLIEDPESDEKAHDRLPLLDLCLAFGGFVLLTIVMLWWGFGP